MKPLRMQIPARLRPHLIRLLKQGLNGSTERQVTLRLLEKKLLRGESPSQLQMLIDAADGYAVVMDAIDDLFGNIAIAPDADKGASQSEGEGRTDQTDGVYRFGMKPIRVQLSRRKGWRMPPGTMNVARPTDWGNPWKVGEDGDAEHCVAEYRRLLTGVPCKACTASR